MASNFFKRKAGNKYNNKKVVYNGLKFDSKAERDLYIKLKALEDKRLIKDLKCQVVFVLQPAYYKKGKLIRPITYRADFTFIDINTGKMRVMDRKGFLDQKYPLKKKIFEYVYPELEIEEV